MQDLAGCDNNRTPVVFRASDNCNIVGGMATIYASWYLQLQSDISIHIISALLFAKNLLQALFLLDPCRAIVFSDLKEKF